jgi:hypothetical protein
LSHHCWKAACKYGGKDLSEARYASLSSPCPTGAELGEVGTEGFGVAVVGVEGSSNRCDTADLGGMDVVFQEGGFVGDLTKGCEKDIRIG